MTWVVDQLLDERDDDTVDVREHVLDVLLHDVISKSVDVTELSHLLKSREDVCVDTGTSLLGLDVIEVLDCETDLGESTDHDLCVSN